MKELDILQRTQVAQEIKRFGINFKMKLLADSAFSHLFPCL